jgi:hypothetical protein
MRARLVTRGARGRWAAVLGAGAIALGLFVAMPALAVSATPGFVQQAYTHAHNVSTLSVTLTATDAAGERLVVEVGVWRNGGGIASAVTDSANDVYVEVTSFTASDGTEMSVWTAPVTSTSTTKPTITAKTSTASDVGIVVLDYSGLSTASDATVVDRQAHATGRTSAAATVSSGATTATTADNELAVGFYADSGFGDAVTAGTGFTPRVTMTPTGDIEAATEDKPVATGALPSATFKTGANTVWLATVVVFKPGVGSGTPTVPGVPTGVSATAGDGSAAVTWSAPPNGGSPITAYTVTPYIGSAAQPATVVSVTSAAIAGLTNGTTYTFTVSATNAVGTGLESVPSNPVTPVVSSSPGQGQWSTLQTWPLVAIQSVLLHNGNFLVWDGWSDPQPTNVWNPATQAFTSTTAPASIFCAGLVQMADGRMMTVGGYGGSATNLGITDADVFDPATSTWSRLANMHLPRWYPTVTELADGRYVAISGNSNDGNHWSDTPEVYDPVANTWTLLSTVSTPQVHEVEYPFSYLTPSGKVFTIGPSEDQSFYLDVPNQTWTPMGSSGVVNGSSDMYRPGKILYTGGAADVNTTTPAKANAAVIDLNGAGPTWQPVAPMNHSRVYHTLTTLADGTVLAVGGESTSDQNVVTSGVLPAEIWNPDTGVWSTVASMSAARNYHSTAVLMPDGRVLVAGGGHVADNSGAGEFSEQIYSPPYLSNGPRPTITSAPASATYASTMSVSTPDAASITGVNLVSLGADTHQGDMDEHFVPLSFTAGSGGLTVQTPAASALAPPGYYMLFLVNNKGVPSMAATVRITATAAAPPDAPANVTATAGNGSASVLWSAPADGGSPITSYTVTPYVGPVALTPTVVTGNPPATGATVTGLTNGTTYTFTVTATNAVGTGSASAPSAPVTPSGTVVPGFVQQATAHAANVKSLAATPASAVTTGNRMVIEVATWGPSNPGASGVTDSAGNHYVELTHFTASDGTEQSVWSAPITQGGGTRPVVTATVTASADVGIAALEYSGLSTVSDASVLDQSAHATGKTSAAATVSSGPTGATTSANELAIGFYADSGFGDALTPGTGFTGRANVSPNGDIEFLVADGVVGQGVQPAATVKTGAQTIWLMATVVLKHS